LARRYLTGNLLRKLTRSLLGAHQPQTAEARGHRAACQERLKRPNAASGKFHGPHLVRRKTCQLLFWEVDRVTH
jgi:hypothetical protein